MSESKQNLAATEKAASKSQRRREALDIRALAAQLIGLGDSRLARVPLDEQLRAEIDRARAIRSHGARKRQLQYVAKLLRRADPQPLFDALDSFENEARQLNARHHRSEAWRDHLLEAGDTAVGELMEQRRDADGQAIRALLRNARREADRNKPPAAARALFRLLRELDEQEPLPPV